MIKVVAIKIFLRFQKKKRLKNNTFIELYIHFYINDRHVKLSVINKLNKKSKHDITN